MAITGEGTSQAFAYTGTIQTFTAPYKGLYKFEVQGGGGVGPWNRLAYGGSGGSSVGYKVLNKGQVLYVVVGGSGISKYNGGGTGGGTKASQGCCCGGGATHIATVSGLLSTLENNKGAVLIVAGGGGGGVYDGYGGAGGGLTGGNGTGDDKGYGGTQTAGGKTTSQLGSTSQGTFGKGADGISHASEDTGAGGGGWYGGSGAGGWEDNGGGGGGSGYIGGVPAITFKGVTYTPTTTNGTNNYSAEATNGKATITLVKKSFPTMYIGSTLGTGMYIGDTEITDIYIGDTRLE